MKILKEIFILTLIPLLFTSAYAQSDFTVTKENVGGDQVKILIEHQNGKYAEYILNGDQDEVNVDFIKNVIQDHSPSGTQNDILQTTIKLPSDEYSSSPIEFFDAGSKIYCFGEREIMIIDPGSGEITNTIPLSNTGNFNIKSLLCNVPVNKFIIGNNSSQRLYCSDPANHFYVVDMQTDQVVITHSLSEYSDQLSTSVAYNEVDDVVYWMVNSWEATNGTQINIYDGYSGTFIAKRYFNHAISDMEVENGNLFITSNGGLEKLNPLTLQTILTYTFPNREYQKIFRINNNEFGVSYYYDDGAPSKKLQLFDVATIVPIQYIGGPTKLIYGILHYQQNNIIVNSQEGGVTSFSFFNKNGGIYEYSGQTISLTDLYAKKMLLNTNGDYAYVAGMDLGKINLATKTIQMSNNLGGCESYDLLLMDQNGTDVLFSANPKEGTYSKHNQDCSQNMVKQSSFRTNAGCYNYNENKAYFVNSRVNWENSGLAIVDCTTDEVSDILQLGKFLLQAEYNSETNKVFVSSRDDRRLFAINGQTDEMIHAIILQHCPEYLCSAGNKIVCKTNYLGEDVIYIINADNYNMVQLNLPTSLAGKKCFKMIPDLSNDKLYVLLGNGFTSILTIKLSTSSIDQINTYTLLDGYDLEYNREEELLYLANLRVPYFFIIDPSDLSIVETVDFTNEQKFSSLDIDVDYYRNKAYLTCGQEIISGTFLKHLVIINLEDYSYETIENDGVKSSLAFNEINERFYYNTLVSDQSNFNELSLGIKDGLDDADLDKVNTQNILNRAYTVGSRYDDLHPVLNAPENKIYWPNGDFSNISVIKGYTDKLALQEGWNWKSFPRMERTGNNPDFSQTILSRINYFPQLELYLIEDFDEDPYKRFLNMTWDGFLDDVFSTKGYKLDMTLLDSPQPDIALHGAKLDPATPITLYPNQENWVGYFIGEPQDSEDAISEDVFEHITYLKAQYWSMTRQGTEPYTWFIKGRVTPIHYGDMVIIEVDSQQSLVWNNPEESAEEVESLSTEYYSFTEQADYLPIFVETDSTSDIQEIAVLAGNEVVGAAVRLPGDTLMEVNAYLEEVPAGTPLELETWTGLKSQPVQVGDYAVKNQNTGMYENRIIYKGERAKYHVVSLKAGQVEPIFENVSNASCSPNPFGNETLFTFNLNTDGHVNLTVYDLEGKRVREILNGHFPAGYYEAPWNGKNAAGMQMQNGIYVYKLITGNGFEVSGKVVLIK
nr:T9SS type A sorting domain-containing protein [Bacteroidota bacterium]